MLENKEKDSGISVHFVNQNYDEGKIILQKTCPILEGETIDTLAAKIHQLEYKYFPIAIEKTLKKL